MSSYTFAKSDKKYDLFRISLRVQMPACANPGRWVPAYLEARPARSYGASPCLVTFPEACQWATRLCEPTRPTWAAILSKGERCADRAME